MSNKILYIIIAVLLLLNIAQFVYFYSKVTDLKSEIRIVKYQNADLLEKNKHNNKDNRPIETW